MSQSTEARAATAPSMLKRFSGTERAVHRAVAILMLICMGTAAVLYNSFLAIPIGHRRLVELVHVYSGFALPIPIVIGLVSGTYRADLGRLNRFTSTDWKWLRSRSRRDGTIRVGKFNAGQKLNAALSAGAIGVLFGTGIIMYFPSLVRLSWRTGSTFVHDWFALAVGLLVLGHIRFAVQDPESRHGMRHGEVTRTWAREQHRQWADEVESSDSPAP
jgi:formate dehydrogenase subunit gamma